MFPLDLDNNLTQGNASTRSHAVSKKMFPLDVDDNLTPEADSMTTLQFFYNFLSLSDYDQRDWLTRLH